MGQGNSSCRWGPMAITAKKYALARIPRAPEFDSMPSLVILFCIECEWNVYNTSAI